MDESNETRTALVSLESITKSFEGTYALRGVSLDIHSGEFVGLVGPNGAGKSTLIKILDGVLVPDSGSIALNGVKVATRGGRLRGIGVVHQDLGLVGTLTVSENLRLGLPPMKALGPFLSARKEHEFAVEALGSVGLDPGIEHRELERLSLGERTLVAIARTLSRGAELVVVDEATSSLSPRESAWLIETLKSQTLSGAAVLMVSHKLSEILESTDRSVVIVDGQVAGDLRTANTNLAALTELMSPARQREERAELSRPSSTVTRDAGPVLSMVDAKTRAAGPFTLDVRPGEIVGITGLVGSGLYDLGLLASGREKCVSGSVEYPRGTRVGLLPPDRTAQASFLAESIGWNLTIGSLEHWRSRFGGLQLHKEWSDAGQRIRELDVRPPRLRTLLASLSGGNQQKVLIGRVLLQSQDLVVLCEPTRGVDVSARAEIYRLVSDLPRNGTAVLVVSSDSEDLLALADRVGVVEGGRCTQTWPVSELTTDRMATLL